MNEKGFGQVDVIAFIFVILLSITIVSILYHQLETDHPSISSDIPASDFTKVEETDSLEEEVTIEASTYQELEDNIAEKSIAYFKTNSTTNDIETVTLQKLIQNQYIPTIYSIENPEADCLGYVEYDKSNEKYTTYLRCGTLYETKGYDMTKEVNED